MVDLLIILVLTLYLLAGFPKIKAAAYRLVPASRRARVTDLGDRVLKQMGGYLSGATIIAIQAGSGRRHLRRHHRPALPVGDRARRPPCWTSSRWSGRSRSAWR